MTQKELEQFLILKEEVDDLAEQRDFLLEHKTSIKSQIISDMPSGSSGFKTADDLMIKINDIIIKLSKKLVILGELILNIETTIENLEPLERKLIRYRYINDLTFYQIAMKLNYSERHTKRLHKEILNKIA
ncbi:sigma factor-like helix-turn-helix DNA-binding protein [Clostridium perfringens]|uniref:sigma factor-like helix-turn-helix DNA-binding protein n=1 Tax=Clostridium perfringens TaxID=1502 RepID=UPI0023308BB3|nr:sigma factor-like helix-turn-helix DNA-binding protein [Clostridium perfringens]MDB2049606.1 sigma factor-like helix-turn-helix DNA-binding protein [Clostridium perfringens]